MLIRQEHIPSLIFILRGERVMFDFHLASLYDVETRVLKQTVRRNISRFPDDFMFELNEKEIEFMVSQNVIPSKSYLGGASPLVFTEQGVAMLSGILRSVKAINVNIAIMRSFVLMRRMLEENKELKKKIEQLESKYDKQFAVVFEAIKQLIHQEAKPKNRIGYRIKDIEK
jgi:hypothetical protein